MIKFKGETNKSGDTAAIFTTEILVETQSKLGGEPGIACDHNNGVLMREVTLMGYLDRG